MRAKVNKRYSSFRFIGRLIYFNAVYAIKAANHAKAVIYTN
jgi:hypothetical protein